MLRCKFRVLSITRGWNNSTVVSMRPCQADDVEYVDGKRVRRENPENARFWSATPTGEASLTFDAGEVPGWVQPGAYVFVDIDPHVEKGERWDTSLTLFSGGGVEVSMFAHRGHLKFGLSEVRARDVCRLILDAYLPAHREGLDGARPTVMWGVAFIPATESPALPE